MPLSDDERNILREIEDEAATLDPSECPCCWSRDPAHDREQCCDEQQARDWAELCNEPPPLGGADDYPPDEVCDPRYPW